MAETIQMPAAPEADTQPKEKTRDNLRDTLQDIYNGTSILDEDSSIDLPEDLGLLEYLEKKTFEASSEDDPYVANIMNKLSTAVESDEKDELESVAEYLDNLHDAIHRGEGVQEMENFIKDNLAQERNVLAAETYKGINSVFSNKSNRAEAQERYDESLRLLGRWEFRDGDMGDKQAEAATIAVEEMQLLREAIDNEYQGAVDAAKEKNWYEKARDGVDSFMKKGIDIKIKGKKRRITWGHIATLGAGFGLGYVLRNGVNAATGGVATVAGGVAGAVTGGVIAGVRAQKDIKSNLRDTADSDEVTLRHNVTGVENLDVALKAHLTAEAQATRNERKKDIKKRVRRGIAVGAITGTLGGGFADLMSAYGGGIGAGISSGVDSLQEASNVDVPNWPDMTDIRDLFDGSDSGGNEVAGDTAGDSGVVEGNADGSEVPSSDVPEIPAETTTPTAEELLQHYAGENADAALSIEPGQGPYDAFEKLGIPESHWDSMMHDEQLMQTLIDNGNGYSLEAAGVQDYGFGLSGSELSPDSVQAMYESAGMDSIDTTVDVPPAAESNLPESYQDLPPEVQEFAEQKYDVVMNIEPGMGGEKLMEALNADPQVWYNFEYDLLQAAPNDFYLMNDGHVGISHTGALSPEAIGALAKGLSQNSYALAA